MRPKLLVAGCGFLGEAVADRAHARGWDVVGWTHSVESALRLESKPYRVRGCDLADAGAVAVGIAQHMPDRILHCASSGRGGPDAYRRVYLAGARCLVASAPGARLVFVGSTSVYAQTDGGEVTELSLAEPERETGRILIEAEQVVLEAGGVVARLAGLYGPDRSVLVRRFLDGSAIIENGGARWINQIHRDDAAEALLRLLEPGVPAGVYNVSDGTALTQRAVYEWLAQHYGRPVPAGGVANPDRKRGWTSKRISNAKLRGLGWAPRFPSMREAVEAGAV